MSRRPKLNRIVVTFLDDGLDDCFYTVALYVGPHEQVPETETVDADSDENAPLPQAAIEAAIASLCRDAGLDKSDVAVEYDL